MKIVLEQSDFDAIRASVDELLDFVPDDALIHFTLEHKSEVLGDAYKWGWDDTEVRDALAECLEDNRKMLRSPHG